MTTACRTALFFSLFFVYGTWYINAQETPASPRILRLADAHVLAEQNSIALQRQAIDLNYDRIRARNLWAQVFPSINISGGARYIIPNNDPPRKIGRAHV